VLDAHDCSSALLLPLNLAVFVMLWSPYHTQSQLTACLATQCALLLEARDACLRASGAAETWSDSVQAALTQELDCRLRWHRPRAGRIEEEARSARSVELLAQQRRVDAQAALQARWVREQAATFSAGVSRLHADAAAAAARLRGMEQLLGAALSCKGIDAAWREAQALRVKLCRELDEASSKLQAKCSAASREIVAANTRFMAEHLRTFEGTQPHVPAGPLAHPTLHAVCMTCTHCSTARPQRVDALPQRVLLPIVPHSL
jgi:hypothetical protein